MHRRPSTGLILAALALVATAAAAAEAPEEMRDVVPAATAAEAFASAEAPAEMFVELEHESAEQLQAEQRTAGELRDVVHVPRESASADVYFYHTIGLVERRNRTRYRAAARQTTTTKHRRTQPRGG